MQDKLNTELSWIRVIDGNLVIGYDVSKEILNEFGDWKSYDLLLSVAKPLVEE